MEGKTFPRFSLMNVRSLLPKIDELSARISLQPTDVIGITESCLSEDIDNNLLSIQGFNIYWKDRACSRGGRVYAYISSGIISKKA